MILDIERGKGETIMCDKQTVKRIVSKMQGIVSSYND